MSSTGSGPRPVRDDAGVYGPALTESMMPAYGSKTLLEATSAAVPGVRQAFIFGRATVVGAELHLESRRCSGLWKRGRPPLIGTWWQ